MIQTISRGYRFVYIIFVYLSSWAIIWFFGLLFTLDDTDLVRWTVDVYVRGYRPSSISCWFRVNDPPSGLLILTPVVTIGPAATRKLQATIGTLQFPTASAGVVASSAHGLWHLSGDENSLSFFFENSSTAGPLSLRRADPCDGRWSMVISGLAV